MGSKNKKEKKERAKKRKLEGEPQKVEIIAPKKKFEPEEPTPTCSDGNWSKFTFYLEFPERKMTILPTREALSYQVGCFVQQKEFTVIEVRL